MDGKSSVTLHAGQAQRAIDFKTLHAQPGLLLLAGAWDAASAKIYALAGFKAIGTSSAGIASSLGYPDGQQMTLQQNLSVARTIVECMDLPVSIDIEAGYSQQPNDMTDVAYAVIATGAVGINIEDSVGGAESLVDVNYQSNKIRYLRKAADELGISLFINARTDVYLQQDTTATGRCSETIRRAGHYMEAGADGIFVPDMGSLDRATIATLVQEINAPLNLIASPTLPKVAELEDLGVARLSLGPRPMRTCLGHLRRIATELIEEGSCQLLSAKAPSYNEVNGWFE